jgi:hypothetical protein
MIRGFLAGHSLQGLNCLTCQTLCLRLGCKRGSRVRRLNRFDLSDVDHSFCIRPLHAATCAYCSATLLKISTPVLNHSSFGAGNCTQSVTCIRMK